MSSSSADSSDEEVETVTEDPSLGVADKSHNEGVDSGRSSRGQRKSEGAVAAAE